MSPLVCLNCHLDEFNFGLFLHRPSPSDKGFNFFFWGHDNVIIPIISLGSVCLDLALILPGFVRTILGQVTLFVAGETVPFLMLFDWIFLVVPAQPLDPLFLK